MQTVRDIAIWYLREYNDGAYRVALFQDFTHNNEQRDGQAFFNCLKGADQERLRGTSVDPFHRDSNIPGAVDLLTTKEV